MDALPLSWRIGPFFSVVKPNQVSLYVCLRFAAAVLITGMFNCVVMRCLAKQQENEQLPAQKAFHRHASRVHNSCKKNPQGDSAPVCGVCVRVCVRHGERKRERERLEKGGGLFCENNIRLFRQNELYYCIQP